MSKLEDNVNDILGIEKKEENKRNLHRNHLLAIMNY